LDKTAIYLPTLQFRAVSRNVQHQHSITINTHVNTELNS